MIKAMKQALAALENSIDTVRNEYENDWRQGLPTRKAQLDAMKEMLDQHEKAIKSLRWAIAEAEKPEPYGYLRVSTAKFVHEVEGTDPMTDKSYLPLYTAPPQRKPLTWERVLEIGLECSNDHSRLPYEVKVARAIEAAHGIKEEA